MPWTPPHPRQTEISLGTPPPLNFILDPRDFFLLKIEYMCSNLTHSSDIYIIK